MQVNYKTVYKLGIYTDKRNDAILASLPMPLTTKITELGRTKIGTLVSTANISGDLEIRFY